MNVKEICRVEKLRFHHPDFSPELKLSLSTLPDNDRRNLHDKFRDCIIAAIAYLVKNMNFKKPLLESISVFDPHERNSRSIASSMPDVARATNQFTSEEMKDLSNEIDIYISLNAEKLPVFKVGSLRLDKDFYVRVWKIMTDYMGRIPEAFIKLTKCVMDKQLLNVGSAKL